MKKGNKRFSTGEHEDNNFLAQQRATAQGQYPAAILLTCMNSRAPAETILDLRIGDVFNSRVAGNVENSDILGSMEFACKLAGAKVGAYRSSRPLWAMSCLVRCSKEHPYSITSSALANTEGGTIRPNTLAVLRLMTN